MPATKQERVRTYARTLFPYPWRRFMGRRTVRRRVQGVDLYLPWSHLLPDYARSKPSYGQNLVELAAGLAARASEPQSPLRILDIGANIGDSTLQLIARTDARVLCVEGDPYWAGYLRMNVGGNPRVTVEEVLLTASDGDWSASAPVREHGTTRFVQDTVRLGALPAVSARELRARNPEFERIRLIKSDTDGFDPVLVPAAATAWRDAGPVLFFEFDPILARAADGRDPNQVWTALADLGYSRLAIWDNGGDRLGQLDIADAAEQARTLEPRPVEYGYYFWDVAACRADDESAIAVFDELVPERFSVHGTWR
ncbi:MAG TPA: FkbM family methyltransferase [Jatrophihabitantaceae bacterium]|nr:FkbM family methyltransferase [Jatrophihabitantaceae bacterium]